MAAAGDSANQQTEIPTSIEVYGKASRFDLELEFVQCLSNPLYLQHLSMNHYFDNEAFVNYCKYLQYFAEPKYARYLLYPGPTLKALELVQDEQFRKDILRPDVVDQLASEWTAHTMQSDKAT